VSETPGVSEIRSTAKKGDMLGALRLELEYMEPGTPIVTAFLMLNTLTGLLDAHGDAETALLAREAISRCGIREAVWEATR
jgi:hypothetical protein